MHEERRSNKELSARLSVARQSNKALLEQQSQYNEGIVQVVAGLKRQLVDRLGAEAELAAGTALKGEEPSRRVEQLELELGNKTVECQAYAESLEVLQREFEHYRQSVREHLERFVGAEADSLFMQKFKQLVDAHNETEREFFEYKRAKEREYSELANKLKQREMQYKLLEMDLRNYEESEKNAEPPVEGERSGGSKFNGERGVAGGNEGLFKETGGRKEKRGVKAVVANNANYMKKMLDI